MEMSSLLIAKGVKVQAFLDINASVIGQKNGLAVFHPQEMHLSRDENTVVIFSIVMDKDMRCDVFNFITRCGFNKILDAQSIRCMLVNFRMNQATLQEYLMIEKERIHQAAANRDGAAHREVVIGEFFARDFAGGIN